MKKKSRWFVAAVCLFSLVFLGYFIRENNALKKRNKQFSRFFANLEKGHREAGLPFGLAAVPAALENVPFADERGIVLDTFKITIRNVPAPYNASIVEDGDGYLLFFRYDEIDEDRSNLHYAYVGCARLDGNFQQTQEEFKKIDTGSNSSEDPRIIRVGDALYLVFNDVQKCGVNCRTMRIGLVNLAESKLDYVTNLDLQIKRVEKNWVPFEYIENSKPFVYFEYYLTPHKILKLDDPASSELTHLSSPGEATYQKLDWPPVWGSLKGGATARKVDDQYLSFFHSFFVDFDGTVWYVMGAYTFEDKPPFRVKRMSKYPILFKTIYNTPPIHTADATKRVIFPGSFLTGIRNGKEVIHLVCGENDCAVKIVTFDKRALLNSLKRI